MVFVYLHLMWRISCFFVFAKEIAKEITWKCSAWNLVLKTCTVVFTRFIIISINFITKEKTNCDFCGFGCLLRIERVKR